MAEGHLAKDTRNAVQPLLGRAFRARRKRATREAVEDWHYFHAWGICFEKVGLVRNRRGLEITPERVLGMERHLRIWFTGDYGFG